MRMRYVVLKETPELKKGAIVKEDCDDGTQGFTCVTPAFEKFEDNGTHYGRKTVINQPEWFEKVDLVYLTKEQVKKIAGQIKIAFYKDEEESDE
jgi:hypothetical protein